MGIDISHHQIEFAQCLFLNQSVFHKIFVLSQKNSYCQDAKDRKGKRQSERSKRKEAKGKRQRQRVRGKGKEAKN